MESNNSYDLLPYPSLPFAQTHPNRIGAIAQLCGVSAAKPETAQVLELGCAAGGNLIPMAVQFPGARFVGIDLSARQVEEGQAAIAALGLDNIVLHTLSITDIHRDFGVFDYILCHGVYSWVPPFVQEAILSVCRENLAPQGVAYVSYNVYPGWHMRGAIRDMMLHHVRAIEGAQARVSSARALLGFLAEHANEKSAYGTMLRDELNLLAKNPDAYLFHEHLEDCNSPVYFHEFVARADAAGLSYVSDTSLSMMGEERLRPEAAKTLRHLAKTMIDQQQYIDFLHNRMFRQSLLTHRSATLSWQFEPAALNPLWISGKVTVRPIREGVAECTTGDGLQWKIPPGPLLEALRQIDAASPQALQIPALIGSALAAAGTPAGIASAQVQPMREGIARALGKMVITGSLSLNLSPWPIAPSVSAHPAASALARWQAATNQSITSQLHAPVNVDAGVRRLLTVLDGSRDISALATYLDGKNSTVTETLTNMLKQGLLAA